MLRDQALKIRALNATARFSKMTEKRHESIDRVVERWPLQIREGSQAEWSAPPSEGKALRRSACGSRSAVARSHQLSWNSAADVRIVWTAASARAHR